VTSELAARLALYRIELLSESKEYSLVARESCFALLRIVEGSVPGIGSSGMMTESGMAYLVWREDQPRLVGKGSDVPARADQVESLRAFAGDLKIALESGEE